MLPSRHELRELAERIRAAVPHARTDRIKRLLLSDALRLTEAAEQLEQNTATLDPLMRRAHIERYERLLAAVVDDQARSVIGTLLREENAALAKERRQIRAWRMRAEELRATADQFSDDTAQGPLRRAAGVMALSYGYGQAPQCGELPAAPQ
jgi:hypothetical protein